MKRIEKKINKKNENRMKEKKRKEKKEKKAKWLGFLCMYQQGVWCHRAQQIQDGG